MAYAWARIQFSDRVVQPGDELSESDFSSDADENEYDMLVEQGVIRNDPFPDDVQPGESVKTALIRKANEQYKAALAGRSSSDPTKPNDSNDEPDDDDGTRPAWLGGK